MAALTANDVFQPRYLAPADVIAFGDTRADVDDEIGAGRRVVQHVVAVLARVFVIARVGRGDDTVIANAAVYLVFALAVGDDVIARAARESVITRPAREDVVAIAAIHRVVTVLAFERVVVLIAQQRVVSGPAA